MARAGLDPTAVVDGAAAIADAEGLEALTLARLAAALGVRTPSLYAHVGGLGDLRARLALRGATSLAEALMPAAAGRARGDALRAVAEAYRAFAHAHPGLYAAIQRAPDGTQPELVAAAEHAVEVIAAVLRGYGLEGDEAVHGVRQVRAALHGFVTLEQGGGFGLLVSVEETWSRLLDTLDRGLAAGA
jgi:AcrR family transcriptional regulator